MTKTKTKTKITRGASWFVTTSYGVRIFLHQIVSWEETEEGETEFRVVRDIRFTTNDPVEAIDELISGVYE